MKKPTKTFIIGALAGLCIGSVAGYNLSPLSINSSVTLSTSTKTIKAENTESTQKLSKTLRELESEIDFFEKQISPLLSEWNREYSIFTNKLKSEDDARIINEKLEEIGDKITEKSKSSEHNISKFSIVNEIYPYYVAHHNWEILYLNHEDFKVSFAHKYPIFHHTPYHYIFTENEIKEIKSVFNDYNINSHYGFVYQQAIYNQAKRLYQDDKGYEGFLALKEGFTSAMTNETASMIASYLHDLGCHEASFAMHHYGKTLPNHDYMIKHRVPFDNNKEESINYQKAREIKSALEEGFFKFSDACELSFYTDGEPFQTENKSDY